MKQQLCKVWCVVALCGLGHAAASTLSSTDQKLVDMAASLNEMALACGYMSADAARNTQVKQR